MWLFQQKHEASAKSRLENATVFLQILSILPKTFSKHSFSYVNFLSKLTFVIILVTAHQDASYLHTDPVRVAGFWIALDDATTENGCLWFARGSHKSGVHRRYIRNPDKNSEDLLIYTSGVPYYQKSSFIPVPVKKGS